MEALRIIFTVILYLNIPIAIASFIFAYILLRRAKGNAIYFNFGMAVLFLALWISSIITYYIPALQDIAVLLGNISFIFGIWILHYFLIFTYKFPFSFRDDRAK